MKKKKKVCEETFHGNLKKKIKNVIGAVFMDKFTQ